MKKFICILLCVSMLSMSAFATNINDVQYVAKAATEASPQIAVPIDEGVYKLIRENTSEIKQTVGYASNDSSIEVLSEDNTIYYNTQNNDLLMAVNEDTLVKASEVIIDPNNLEQANELIDRYNISEKMADDIRAFISSVAEGKIIPEDDLRIYVARDTNPKTRVSGESVGSYYFTGYKGQRYYQELFHYSGFSKAFRVYQPTVAERIDSYLQSVLKNVATSIADGAIGTVAGASWTFISVFATADYNALSSIKTLSTTYSHTAQLHENKYIRYTFVATSVGNQLGAVTEYTNDYHFQDQFNVPGYKTYAGNNTKSCTAVAPGYYNADELAYSHYPSGYTEYISRIQSYKYQNQSKNITITVSSVI